MSGRTSAPAVSSEICRFFALRKAARCQWMASFQMIQRCTDVNGLFIFFSFRDLSAHDSGSSEKAQQKSGTTNPLITKLIQENFMRLNQRTLIRKLGRQQPRQNCRICFWIQVLMEGNSSPWDPNELCTSFFLKKLKYEWFKRAHAFPVNEHVFCKLAVQEQLKLSQNRFHSVTCQRLGRNTILIFAAKPPTIVGLTNDRLNNWMSTVGANVCWTGFAYFFLQHIFD